MDMQYLAYRVNGDGTEEMLDPDLPLSGVRVTREKNGIGRLTASLPPEYETAHSSGRRIIKEWSTAIYVRVDGIVFDAFFVAETSADNEMLELDCVGWTGYADGQPWSDRSHPYNKGNVLASDVVEEIWSEVQRLRGADIGLEVMTGYGTYPRIGLPVDPPPAPGPVVGLWTPKPGPQPKAPKYPSGSRPAITNYKQEREQYERDLKDWQRRKDAYDKAKREYEERQRKFKQEKEAREKAFEDAKIKLNYWSTHDLLRVFQQLSEEAGFSYRMLHHLPNDNGGRHYLHCDPLYLGNRTSKFQLIEGENVMTVPKITHAGGDKVTSAVILGAGEGSKMMWAQTSTRAGYANGLRRAKVFADKSLNRYEQLRQAANSALAAYGDPIEVEEFDVVDHGLAPITSIDVGDQIRLITNDRRGADEELWVSIEAISLEPEKQRYTLAVTPITEFSKFGTSITGTPPGGVDTNTPGGLWGNSIISNG